MMRLKIGKEKRHDGPFSSTSATHLPTDAARLSGSQAQDRITKNRSHYKMGPVVETIILGNAIMLALLIWNMFDWTGHAGE